MRLPWRDVDGISTTLTSAEIGRLRELAAGALVLEIGSGYGYSSIHMALAGARLVLAVDPHAGEVPGAWETIQRHWSEYEAWDRIAPLRATSQAALPLLADDSFDLVFVDGDHSRDAVLHDVVQGWRLLKPGGVLACHDYYEEWCVEVGPALDSWGGPDEVVDTLWLRRKSDPGRIG